MRFIFLLLSAVLIAASPAMAQVSTTLPAPPVLDPVTSTQPTPSAEPFGRTGFANDLESIKGRLKRRQESAQKFKKKVEDTRPSIASTLGLTDRRSVIVELTYIRSELEEFRARIEEDEKGIIRLKTAVNEEKRRIENDIHAVTRRSPTEFDTPESQLANARNNVKFQLDSFENNKTAQKNVLEGDKRMLEQSMNSNTPLQTNVQLFSSFGEQLFIAAGLMPDENDIAMIDRFIAEIDTQTVEQDYNVQSARDTVRNLEAVVQRAEAERARIQGQSVHLPEYNVTLRTLESISLEYEAIKDQRAADSADVDQYITNFISNADSEAQSTWMVAGIFFLLMAAIIWQLFRAIGSDPVIQRAVFSNDAALQFVALLSIIIAIIIFGITKILGGNELSALLGSIAGYILGRSSDKLAKPKEDLGGGGGQEGANA